MLKITSHHTRKKLLNFVKQLKEEQNKIQEEDLIAHSKVKLTFVLENKIFNLDIIFHPLALLKLKFYQDPVYIENLVDYTKFLHEIILYELDSEQENFLNHQQLKKVIKEYNLLKKRITP